MPEPAPVIAETLSLKFLMVIPSWGGLRRTVSAQSDYERYQMAESVHRTGGSAGRGSGSPLFIKRGVPGTDTGTAARSHSNSGNPP